MDIEEQVRLIKAARQLHPKWYAATYPDVEMVGMDAVEHYVRYGSLMGRKPRNGFDTSFYLSRYADVAKSGLNPLIHYILVGEAEGRLQRVEDLERVRDRAKRTVADIAKKLLSCGFLDRPIAEFRELIEGDFEPFTKFFAARELALWNYRLRSPDGYGEALRYASIARSHAQTDNDFMRALSIESLCHYQLGQREQGMALLPLAAGREALFPDIQLAHSNFVEDEASRIAFINAALAARSIPAIALRQEAGLGRYDRLEAAAQLTKLSRHEGPKVSILLASYNAAATLPTALRSLLQQTWQNIEILVIDDCSTDNSAEVVAGFAEADPRIRFVSLPRNSGAYVARNLGLDLATGSYTTIHDADDWSHPIKLEKQIRFLMETPGAFGCTSQQARATNDLAFTRMNGEGYITHLNSSSFMFRTQALRDKFGYWDEVRFGADTEMLKRIAAALGANALREMSTGPLSFQRISETSLVGDEFFGIDGSHFGARYAYSEAYSLRHARSKRRRYDKDSARRPFPAPYPMLPGRAKLAEPRHFDVVIASDFRMLGGSTRSCIEEVICQRRSGVKTAVMQMYRYDFDTKTSFLTVFDEVMDVSDLDVVVFGENISCDLLIIRYPPVLQEYQRFLPRVVAKEIKVIINQTPMSEYSGAGDVRFTFKEAAQNLLQYFGKSAAWYPIGPLVRETLHQHHADELHHIKLADQDWFNIIDIEGWSRGRRRRGPSDRLRIGRHSRDAFVKWPGTKEEVLAAYPASDDVEVHVLGGATSPLALIGQIPGNWTVYEFGSLAPAVFLAQLDVFIYFTHPDWVESFGRTIIEAMAVGVPVILPETYKPLFADSVLYAEPHTAIELARRLHADEIAYEAQVQKAWRYVAKNFSHETHLLRLRGAGVTLAGTADEVMSK
ncbi:glycosyltransferase [Roseomonas sp. F4]